MCDRCGSVFVAPCKIQCNWYVLCASCCERYNGKPLPSQNVTSDEMITWAKFVSKWNSTQPFKDEIYAIPKRGGLTYTEVRELFDEERGIVKPKPEPEPVVKPEPKSEPVKREAKKYDYPEKPSWDDLIQIRGTYWMDELASGYGGKTWAIPMLPKPSREASLLKETFPKLNNKEINMILKGANQARRAGRAEM